MKTKITTLSGMTCCLMMSFSPHSGYAGNNGVIQGVNTTQSLAPGVKQQSDAGLRNYQVYKINPKAIHDRGKGINSASAESSAGILSLQLRD